MFHLGNSIRKRFYRGVHIMTSFYLAKNLLLKFENTSEQGFTDQNRLVPDRRPRLVKTKMVEIFSETKKSFKSKVITQKFYLWSLVLELHYSHFKL